VIRLALGWSLWRSLDPEDQAFVRQLSVNPLSFCMAARDIGLNTDTKIHLLLTDERYSDGLNKVLVAARSG
jgi:hypothetical protein